MSKFSGGGGDAGAGDARKREAERKANIAKGMAKINAIFNGSKRGSGGVTGGYQAGQTYYLADGTPVTYGSQTVAVTPPKVSEAQAAAQKLAAGRGEVSSTAAKQQQATRNANGYFKNGKFVESADQLFSGYDESGGFNEDFYNKRRDEYTGYQTPYLDEDFNDQKAQLTYALSRAAKLNSSSASNRFGKLQDKYQQNRDMIQSKGVDYANGIRTNVGNARTDLINMLNATEDPALIADEATRAAQIQSQPGQFAPLGDFFSNVTSGLETALNSPSTGYRGVRGLYQDAGNNKATTIVN